MASLVGTWIIAIAWTQQAVCVNKESVCFGGPCGVHHTCYARVKHTSIKINAAVIVLLVEGADIQRTRHFGEEVILQNDAIDGGRFPRDPLCLLIVTVQTQPG